MTTELAIDVRDLTRSFVKRSGWRRSSERIEAVRGVSFSVPRGTIFGVLGPNGAGKTTTIKMLSTLLLPSSGTASINGLDIVRDEHRVRSQLGVLFGGDKGLYNQLSATENMRYFGRLYALDDATIKRQTERLLDRVKLLDRADERVESYSRGMKQRLHIAKSLIHDPDVVILDEPTIGLDPKAAIDVRELIGDLVPDHTVLLTTHDMHEADVLCRELAIVDKGLIVAHGTPAALKNGAQIDRRVVLTLANGHPDASDLAVQMQSSPAVISASSQLGESGEHRLELVCTDSSVALDESLSLLRTTGVHVAAIDIREPSLEDAFLNATGREFESNGAAPEDEEAA